ncbi:MAG TPA: hypothetical protein HA349_10625 [Methanotrichaceae archaeon]|nr:hypothetical protein [Methanotrichaceae archaeon]
MMNKIIISSACAVFLLFFAVVGAFALPEIPFSAVLDCSDANSGAEISFLFVQEGENGTFVDEGDGNYTLTIKAKPYTVYFSDRPYTIAGSISTGEFVDGFDWTVPPNAAVVVIGGTEEENVVIVQLRNPRYSEDEGTLRYSATIIGDYGAEGLSYYELLRDDSIPQEFGAVSIYIDTEIVNPQITDAVT